MRGKKPRKPTVKDAALGTDSSAKSTEVQDANSLEFKYLAIKNWDRFQSVTTSRKWIKDWIDKENDHDYGELTGFQRYILDGCCRLRGKLARNLHNDHTWIARALHLTATDRAHLGHAIHTLIVRRFLVPSNQQLDIELCGKREKEIKKEKENEREMAQSAPLFSGEPVAVNAAVIVLPLVDGTNHLIFDDDVSEWGKLYPAVDVMQEFRKMRGWLLSNPTRRKTRSGIKSFMNKWLSKEQDHGGPAFGNGNGNGNGHRNGNGNGGGNGYRKQTPLEQANDRIREIRAEGELDGGEVGGGLCGGEQAGAGDEGPEDDLTRSGYAIH